MNSNVQTSSSVSLLATFRRHALLGDQVPARMVEQLMEPIPIRRRRPSRQSSARDSRARAPERPAQRLPWPGGVAVPLVLDVSPCLPVALDLVQPPGEEGRSEQRHPDREQLGRLAAERIAVLLPDQDRERQDQEHAVRPGQRRQRAEHAGQPPALEPGRKERADQQHQEGRLGVDRGEEERGREEGQRPDRGGRDSCGRNRARAGGRAAPGRPRSKCSRSGSRLPRTKYRTSRAGSASPMGRAAKTQPWQYGPRSPRPRSVGTRGRPTSASG